MDKDNKNNQNDQFIEEKQISVETESEYRDISDEELKQVLEDHKKWLESDGKEGKRANLVKVDLQKAYLRDFNFQSADLREANLLMADLGIANLQMADLGLAKLQKAYLVGANLQKAFLKEADLKMANLRDAKLQKANLSKAKMQNTGLDDVKGLEEANLQYANLEGATGLLGNEFAQADVTGTKLPDDIKEFKALEIVKETSQNARKIFFSMLLGCVYSWLTIATTTDVRLLTNTASSPLPIIGTEIPIAWFYIAAPLVLICLYLYFHLYLDNLWEGLSSLPAIFPDGKRLDQRAYPWLLNTLVRKHFNRLKKRSLFAKMKEWISIFLAWWIVPITMISFWLRYLPRHDWRGTYFHIGLIVLSVAFGIVSYRLCALTLQGKKNSVYRLHHFWRDRRFYYGMSVFGVGVLFSILSYGAIEGDKKWYWPKERSEKNLSIIKKKVPILFEKFGYSVFANFNEKEVSEIPFNYWELIQENRIESVKGANLRNANLNNADMHMAFLVKADLQGAFINNADLYKVNLQKSNLTDVKIQRSHLKESNLQQATLEKANLKETIFVNANLYNAILKDSNLRQANLLWSNFEKTNLMYADFNEVYIFGTNLKEAILAYADFKNAKVHETDLRKADFQDANLADADFRSSNLTGAKKLTIEQLSKAKTLYQAKLDPEIMEQVKKCCPHLLEKPKEETDQKDTAQ